MKESEFRPSSPLYMSVCAARNPRWTVVKTYDGRWWVVEPCSPEVVSAVDQDSFVSTYADALRRALVFAAADAEMESMKYLL